MLLLGSGDACTMTDGAVVSLFAEWRQANEAGRDVADYTLPPE